MQRSVHVEVHREWGGYWAQVRDWPGCFASGRTWDELTEALEESIGLWITPDGQEGYPRVALRILAMELEVDADRALLRGRAESSDEPLPARRRVRDEHVDWPLRDLRRRGED